MESEATTMSMPVDDEVDESNAARKRKRSRKSKVCREMTEGKNTKDDKVLSLTVDNASYNDVMVKHMKNSLGSRGMLVSGGCFFHIRCCAHIINIIVQSGLSCIENILDKIRNLVKYVTRSSSRSKDFYDTAQKHFHLDAKRKLRMDMQVRWNSTYMMLDNVLYYKDVFIHLGSFHASFKSNVPLDDEWENLSVVHKFLKLFYDVTSGDTFRAAASDQLEIWAERTDCEIVVAEKEKAKASSDETSKLKRFSITIGFLC
uniref:SRP54-type proteins GTP-binding domain-containing protein n=1 Tax=Chenopodium quinoa TaxID=63459 RepID=A0A803MDX6_CHEQI